ncbi:unnamed protein product [Lampetra fluviatilis]
MQQSYVTALIAMMAWSITYHSWLTFVLLLWSCLIWMMRNRRHYTMLSAPFLVAYGNVLCLLAYVWSLRLNEHELPLKVGVVEFAPIGLVREDIPCVSLGSKLLYNATFWLLLRQRLKERLEAQPEKEQPPPPPGEAEGEAGSNLMHVLGALVRGLFVKYWIYVCGGMFFFVGLQGRLVTYKIIYMALCLGCVALYQVHYNWWRRLLKYFWMVVVSYTMLVTIFIYTYQFESFPGLWRNMTRLSDSQLRDLGLQQFSVSELFTQVLIPTAFLLCCILQLHYFHDSFLALTDLDRAARANQGVAYRCQKEEDEDEDDEMETEEEEEEEEEERNKWMLVLDRLTVLFLKSVDILRKVQTLVWRILELHIIKVVSFYIIWISLKDVSLMNSLFLGLWVFALPCVRFRPLAASISTVWACVLIICKMIYQLDTIDPIHYSSNCSVPLLNETSLETEELLRGSTLYAGPVDPLPWVGIRKSRPVFSYIRHHVVALALLVVEITVMRRQLYHRLHFGLTPPLMSTVFENVSRRNLDEGIVGCIKYFINYGFYKFGLEICLLTAVNTVGQRMDLYACLHGACMLALMARRRRKAIAQAWPRYCLFLASLMLFQYLLCIGIPPALCKEYPWRFAGATFNSNLIKWLFFPDFAMRPNPILIIYDCMLLLVASLQLCVFEEENRAAVRLQAGDNVEVCWSLNAVDFSSDNPVPDFIHCKSYLDMIKVILFSYLFWFVLIVIFFAGTMRISFFCMGYLVGCFYFLLFGGQLLLQPLRRTLLLWDYMIAYNVTVIVVKNVLSIAACAYLRSLGENCCWLVQAFSLVCTIKGYNQDFPDPKLCELPRAEAGIIWDAICFFFLLLQRRVFLSYYYLHVVADLQASTLLASRGAELIHAEMVKSVKARMEEEKKSMDQLKRQMERIIARQQKFKKGKESAPVEAPEGAGKESGEKEPDGKKKRKQWWRPWVDHASMVRSGDYYLFETDSEEEEEDEERDGAATQEKSAFQFAYHAWVTDSRSALKERQREKKQIRREQRDKQRSKQHGVVRRALYIVKFTYVLSLAFLDSFVEWLNAVSREYANISTVLRIERCMLSREVKKGNVPSKESIMSYYHTKMNHSEDEASVDESGPSSGRGPRRGEGSQVRERGARPARLRGAPSSQDSVLIEATQVTTLASRQGTADTIEEASDEEDAAARGGTRGWRDPGRGRHRRDGDDEEDDGEEEEGRRLRRRGAAGATGTSDYSCATGEGATSDDVEFEAEDESPAEFPRGIDEAPPTYSKAASLDSLPEAGVVVLRKSPAPKEAAAVDLGDRPKSLLSVQSGDAPALALSHQHTASELLLNRLFEDDDLDDSDRFYTEQTRLLKLFFALYNTVVARSEMMCYFIIILNHMISASSITLVLPILIFLWAMLSVPRPSKRFWMTAIVYTEVTVVIKYFFQFGFFPWNTMVRLALSLDKPFDPATIIGVEKKEGYVYYDLVQLLVLFFHRSILKCYGLWDDAEEEQATPGEEASAGGGDGSPAAPGSRKPSCQEAARPLGERPRRASAEPAPSVSIAGPPPPGPPAVAGPPAIPSGPLLAVPRGPGPGGAGCHSGGPRRKSSGISQLSGHSSRPGSSRKGSSRKGSRMPTPPAPRTRKDLLMMKAQELAMRCRNFVIARVLQVYRPIRQFFYDLIHPDFSPVTDVYALMFMADVVDFIIIVFGYWAFGKHSAAADIASSLSEDQVPQAFLVMLLLQFSTMVVDRALYLRKTVLGKVIFQVVLVFGIHFWMFFILPGVTERKFNLNTVAQLWYFVKCVYFGLSAYQIRCGYPTRILGNFLTKKYNYMNLFLFQGFRLVPFLIELRAIMDWVWTDTTLSLSSWICIEDIYANTFILKCWRESEKRYPQPRGQKKKKMVKYGMGGMMVFLLICIVWFPLLFMSLVKSVAGVVNPPIDVSVSLSLGGYEPLYMMSAQQQSLVRFSETEYKKLTNTFGNQASAMQFITVYSAEDITTARLAGNSTAVWGISPPSRNKLIQELLSNASGITLRFYWKIQRDPKMGGKSEVSREKHTIEMNATHPARAQIAAMLQDSSTHSAVLIKNLFPPYLKAPGGPDSTPVRQMLPEGERSYSDVELVLRQGGPAGSSHAEWWSLRQLRSDCPGRRCDDIRIIVFSDRVSPPSLGFLAGYGIVGLYASVVLVVGKFVREFFSGISHSIMFEELPNVDRALKLCTDIFLVRETGELQLEEDLYAKLIFLYRSPETMIKWTREKED